MNGRLHVKVPLGPVRQQATGSARIISKREGLEEGAIGRGKHKKTRKVVLPGLV